ncbi:hypothetical protein B7463_g2944, partial [Scytalidium lignicola]
MSEFIGSRISLVSRSDIRYVGTLHEINSETSTVALENVTSFGTEGRKANPDDEIPPSDSVYEYIVFRGSDVKDLRIEEAPAPKETKPPQVPNDPAILGSGARPQQAPIQNQPPVGVSQAGSTGPQQPGQPPHFNQYPPQYFPPPAGWGRAGPGPGPGYPGMPYGAPPGWYPPPGQGFPPAPFAPYGYPPGPPGPPGAQFPQGAGPKPAPIGQGVNKQQTPGPATGPVADKQPESKSTSKPAAELTAAPAKDAPTQAALAKPSPTTTQAPSAQSAAAQNPTSTTAPRAAPVGPKSATRIQPAVPLPSSATAKNQQPATTNSSSASATVTSATLRDATEAATAAVAAAMAKLPPINGQSNGNAIDNLAQKVNEMRANDATRGPRQPGASGFPDRGRGRGRGRAEVRKVEVPTTDYDFESANAKFNKGDLVKEAIAGSPLGETQNASAPEANGDSGKPALPVPGYNKSTSFFDNISSEAKERAEGSGVRPGGREWRGEEQRKNLETFGQGSVDNGFRGGFRGRGRGRGYRGRGYIGHPGQGGRARGGGYRGGRGDSQTAIHAKYKIYTIKYLLEVTPRLPSAGVIAAKLLTTTNLLTWQKKEGEIKLKMSFEVQEMSHADLETVVKIEFRAFHPNDTLHMLIYPSPVVPTPSVIEQTTKRQLENWTTGKPPGSEVKWVKAVDTETGEIIGAAKWIFFDKAAGESEEEKQGGKKRWPEAGFKTNWLEPAIPLGGSEGVKGLAGMTGVDDQAYVPLHYLISAFVTLHIKKRGVGKMLVKYGITKADEMGVKSYVEASPLGRRLYKFCGFELVEKVLMHGKDMRDDWKDRALIQYDWLVREVGGPKEYI